MLGADSPSSSGIDVILNIRPDDILCSFGDPGTFMQQRALGLAMWKDCNATHDRFDRVGVHDTLSHARDEESGLSALEFVVEVDQECEERRLAGSRRR